MKNHTNFFQKNVFDSDIYSGAVYTATLADTSNTTFFEQELSYPYITTAKRLFVEIPWNQRLIHILQKHKFLLTAEKITYQFDAAYPYNHTTPLKDIKIMEGIPPLRDFTFEKYDWSDLGVTLGKTSRYYHDLKEPSLYKKIYHEWLYNTMHGYANYVICLIACNTVIGIISLKHVSLDQVFIDLLGFTPNFQGKGLGKYLLSKALKYGAQHNKKLFVSTTMHNLHANKFYQKNGFFLHSAGLLYCKYVTDQDYLLLQN